MDQFSKLVAKSAEGIKHSSIEASDEQLRKIKKMICEELKSFKRKGNEIILKLCIEFILSLKHVKSHLESNVVEKAKAS